MSETPLLSTTYFGPVQWYQKLARSPEVVIERWEHFQKQTYRNRCVIATTQGTQALTVPIVRGESPLIKDIRISDHGNWRHLHWRALRSAYGESPFFEFYQDDIRPFFEQRWEYLFDFNEAIRETVCQLLDIQPQVAFTDAFASGDTFASADTFASVDTFASTAIRDFRSTIDPKHPQDDPDFDCRPYYQVYGRKHGFLPNLSILDLLFNMGPESIVILMGNVDIFG